MLSNSYDDENEDVYVNEIKDPSYHEPNRVSQHPSTPMTSLAQITNANILKRKQMIDQPGTSINHGKPPAIHVRPRQKTVNAERRQMKPYVVEEAPRPEPKPQGSYTVRALSSRTEQLDLNEGMTQTRIKYINYAKAYVVITNSDNIQFPIEPSLRPYGMDDEDEGYIEIRQETILIGRTALAELQRLIDTNEREVASPELKDLRLAMIAALTNHPVKDEMENTGVVVTRTWRIDADELFIEGRRFIEHIGVFLSFTHKNSHAAFGTSYLERMSHNVPEDATGFSITVVDNEDIAGNRYMYAAGEVMTFKPIRRPDLQSGVYVYTRGQSKTLNSEYYTFSEAMHKLQMYDNQADAATNGNPENFYKTAVHDRKYEQDMKRIEYSQELQEKQAANEQRRHELEVELMELRAQAEKDRVQAEKERAELSRAIIEADQKHKQQMADFKREMEQKLHDAKVAREEEDRERKVRNEEEDRQRKVRIEEEDRQREADRKEEDRQREEAYKEKERKLKKKQEKEDRKHAKMLARQERKRKAEVEEEERERKAKIEKEDRERKIAQEKEDRERKERNDAEDRERNRRIEEDEQRRRQHQDNLRWGREQERMFKQDVYEDRSYQRKDSSEMIKQVPLYVTAALAAFTAYATYKSTKANRSISNGSVYDV